MSNRHDPQNYVTLLPVEIWRECFMLLGTTEHKKLAKICRFFHDICLAFIFKSITLSSRIVFYKSASPQYMTRQLEKLSDNIGRFTTLAMSPRYASLVRKCTLRHSLRLYTSLDEDVAKLAKDAYESSIQAFVEGLPQFVNTREIKIDCEKSKMDRRVLAVLATLPQVEKLSLVSVRSEVHQLKPQIKVKKLWIHKSTSNANPNEAAKRLDLFSSGHLEELCIFSKAYTRRIFLALTDRGPLKNLTNLSFDLNAKDLDILCRFLAMCPNIESLRVIPGRNDDTTKRIAFPSLPQSTVPFLQSFSGHESVAKVFVPGRPVKKVCIRQSDTRMDRHYSDLEDIIPYLCQSTGPVIDLEFVNMQSEPDVMALLTTRLPRLSRLTLGLSFLDLFPEEDPHSIPLEILGLNECVSRQTGKAASRSNAVMAPIAEHAAYISLMHWTAHGKVVLPPSLETLHLLDDFSSELVPFALDFDSESDSESDSDSDDWYRYAKEKPKRLKMVPYTFAMAESIFDSISVQYPALQRLIIGNSRERKEWIKSTNKKWNFLSRKRHGHFISDSD